MPTPTFSLDFSKVGIGILVIDFQENIFMSSDRFQNLQKNFSSIKEATQLSMTFHFRVVIKTK
jgi:hypothetical protein